MNKLLLVEDINNIKSGNYELNYQKNTIINITDNVALNDYNNIYDLNINIKSNSKVFLDKVNILNKNLNLLIN